MGGGGGGKATPKRMLFDGSMCCGYTFASFCNVLTQSKKKKEIYSMYTSSDIFKYI